MCLDYDEKLTEKGLKGKKVHSNGMIKAWKFLSSWCHSLNLNSPYAQMYIPGGYKYKPGWNKSNRNSVKITDQEKRTMSVHKGIHVFLSRETARNEVRFCNRFADCSYKTYKNVPVKVYEKELVSVGHFESKKAAVFTKVFLKKDDYDKALKIPANK